MKQIFYFILILLCLLLCLSVKVNVAEAFWLFGGERVVEVKNEPKTIESEIDRLSALYGVDKEKATKIIICESNKKPDAIRVNTTGTIDYSYWQINDFYWSKQMADIGWDITNPEDNLEAGFYLLSKYGDSLWGWSKYCWGK